MNLVNQGVVFLSAIVYLLSLPKVLCGKKYAMDEECGRTIKMDGRIFHMANIRQTFRKNYAINSNCQLIFETMESYRFIIVFKRLDIEFEPLCDDDNLQIFDGNTTSHPIVKGLPSRICGKERPPGSYVSKGNKILMAFRSDFYDVRDGFEIILTTFRKAPCEEDEEFKCRNGRCISSLLQCDGINNCGDYSDECQWSAGVLFAIMGAILFITVTGIVGVRFVRRKRLLRIPKKGKKENSTETFMDTFSTPLPDINLLCEHHRKSISKRSMAAKPEVHQQNCQSKEETNDT
ncbi:uncharacterized protein LOC133196875, partial [Saccostrea echinata]|uniref:uncharacterized protein LOC133196875 n=1 Tax=Saccostrea echinata TaxID=191078 RepID=UPI002A7F6003